MNISPNQGQVQRLKGGRGGARVGARIQNRLGSTGYQPVLAGNLPGSLWTLEEPVGRLPTGTGKLPVLPLVKTRPNYSR